MKRSCVRSEGNTKEVGQECVLKIFNLGGYRKFPDEHTKHVLIPGSHSDELRWKDNGKEMYGSDYSGILTETCLATTAILRMF